MKYITTLATYPSLESMKTNAAQNLNIKQYIDQHFVLAACTLKSYSVYKYFTHQFEMR